MKNKIFFICVAILLLRAATATADDPPKGFLPLSGRWFTDLYVPFSRQDPNKPLEQLSSSLWLETDPHLNADLWFKLIYEGNAFDGGDATSFGVSQSNHLESTFREAYATYSHGGFEIRAGKQIISWGKSDGINPTDFHSAKDFSFFNNDQEVVRQASQSLEVSLTPDEGSSPWTFTAIYTYLFAQSRLLIPPSLLQNGITLSDPQGYSPSWNSGEQSLKASYNGSGWDASLSVFSGYNHLPELQETSYTVIGVTPQVAVAQVFRHITAVGVDGSYSFPEWVLRWESSYTQTPNNDGTNPVMMPSHWDSVLGGERGFGKYFRGQVQLIFRYFPFYQDPSTAMGPDPVSTLIAQNLAISNALLQQYEEASRPLASLRISYSNEDNKIDADIFYLQNFSGYDHVIQPRFTYSWSDALKTTVGADLYGGPGNRPFGALNIFSAVYSELKYIF